MRFDKAAPPVSQTANSTGIAAFRSVSALLLREMGTRYGRSPGGYIWALVQPLGIIALLAFAFSLLARTPALGTSFVLFKATGYLLMQCFTNISSTVGGSISYSRSLLLYPRVSWIDAVIARFLLNTLVIWVVGFIILIGIVIVQDLHVTLDWGNIFLSAVLTTLLGLGFGCLNAYMFMRFPVWTNVWGIVTAPLFMISGVLFLYENMPPLGQAILWYNPLLHLTGLMRAGFYSAYSPTYISVPYVVAFALFPMVVGLLLLRQFHRDLLFR
ncbi:ABC transporter permease [Roseinatronobacter sp. NSM]|uniref:ABC transporter permease n=1 Tax=Roseinatronobacter sp. NSM TaxID=3457785 RepID=UPI004036DEF6